MCKETMAAASMPVMRPLCLSKFVSPFQGYGALGHPFPRALPWADLYGPLGAMRQDRPEGAKTNQPRAKREGKAVKRRPGKRNQKEHEP